MGKFGKKNQLSMNPLDYTLCLMGNSGIGKSTLMKEYCSKLAGDKGYIALDIGREDGHKAINGIVTESVPDWGTFREIVDDIVENKTTDYPNLKTVIIDTYDEFCSIAEKEAIRLWNRKDDVKHAESINAAWGGFGKGLDKTIELMLDSLWDLKSVGVNFNIVAHTKQKDIEDVMAEEKYTQITANISQKYFNAIKTKLHFVGVAYVDREIVKMDTGKKNIKTGEKIYKGKATSESRVINFRDDTYSIDSKSRFADIEPQITFDCDELIKAITNAIEKEHNKSGESVAATKKRMKEIEEKSAKEYEEKSKTRKKMHVDAEANEKYVDIIRTEYSDAEEDVKAQVRAIMAEYEIPNFKHPSELATEGLEKIVKVL